MTDQAEPDSPDDGVNMPASRTPDADGAYSPKILLREKTGEDRRESERRSYYVGVHIATDREAAFGLSGNISSGGLFVVTEDPPGLGSRLELEFLVEGTATLVVHGEVRWVRRQWDRQENRPPGFGVEFDALEADQQAELEALLATLDAAHE